MKKIMECIRLRLSLCWPGLLLGALIGLGPVFATADPALRYQRVSNRIDRRDTRVNYRIDRRDTRINNRIDRRDYLLSPPAGATRVAVGGASYYRAGGVYYQPQCYEGKTVYVQVDVH